jgi:hypothetical protein
VITFRNTDLDVPFQWETDVQPAQRWHGSGEGPAQYMSTTPDASWAEFCRHEDIRDTADLAGVERALWTIEFDDESEMYGQPELPLAMTTGDASTYSDCQQEARRLRVGGASALAAQAAAVSRESESGWRTEEGLQPADPRPESTIVLFGTRQRAVAWYGCAPGRPSASLLGRVRYL